MRQDKLDQLRERIVGDFKDHIAAYHEVEPEDLPENTEVLYWARPKSNTYYIRYVVMGLYLMVTGDMGDAVYQWGSKVTFTWIAGLDLSYFVRKCLASECGRGYKTWDKDWLNDERMDELTDEYGAEKINLLCNEGGRGVSSNKIEWTLWLNEYGYDVFGEDYYELGNAGEDFDIRAVYHFDGLKMAMAQLKEQGVELT